MTADGTYPVTRAGETVSTATELDALPVGSVVLDGDRDAWQRCSDTTRQDEDGQYMRSAWACPAWTADRTSREVIEGGRINCLHVAPAHLPLTVLFRPDAPQPATGDAVERAARAIARAADADGWVDEIAAWEGQEQWERDAHPEERPESAYEDREAFRSQARAALAAARAGEAEVPCFCSPADGDYGHPECKAHQSAQRGEEAVDPDDPRRLYDLTPEQSEAAWRVGSGVRRDEHPTVDHDFTRGGEAVDREALGQIVADLAEKEWGISAHASPRISHLRIVDAILAARGDAAPTVSAEQVRDHLNAYEEVDGQCVSVADLAALGIEVRP